MAPHKLLTAAGTGAAAVLLAAAAAAPALADGQGNDGNNGNHYGQTKDHSNNGQGAGGQATGQSSDDSSTGHNPPGNNGTVKIHDDYADTAHHNVPHVDCDFAVAFWGFDQGQTMDVSFAGQAPTGKGTPLTVTGAETSIASPDDAGGGQDYDGELDFTADQLDLSSLGAPHPKQGYHIKLTVDTYEPGGHKYKVFWLQPCAQPETSTTESGTTTTTQPDTTTTGTAVTQPTGTEVEGTSTAAGQSSGAAATSATAGNPSSKIPTHVLGEHFTRNAATPAAGSLPFTGLEIGGFAAAAALLLGSGTLLTVAARRRKRA